MAEALFWPALVGYGEAAIAFTSPRYTRLAIWGVRIGWLAQTGLLVYQAARVDGFPWASWSGSLNLFVWLIVGWYLIWGCQERYRHVGLTVMPFAAGFLIASAIGGGTAVMAPSHYPNLFLTIHVGFVLAAFAGFTLAASLATLFLLEERRLHRHSPDILRLKLPSLVVLEKLTVRTIAVSLPLLTVGLVAGFIRLDQENKSADSLAAAMIIAWVVYAGLLAVRPKGRRTAYLALAGFAIVILARIALAGSHF